MMTIQIEANISTEQLLHAVERLPPRNSQRSSSGSRSAAQGELAPEADSDGRSTQAQPAEQNPYLAAAGMFAHDSFAAEVDAYIAAQREREREEAAREADA